MAGWRDKAACRDEDPELFFSVGTSGPALAQVAAAKAVCGSCSVRSSCDEHEQPYGVWGGKSEDDRAAARRRSRAG